MHKEIIIYSNIVFFFFFFFFLSHITFINIAAIYSGQKKSPVVKYSYCYSKVWKSRASITCDDLQPPNRCSRNQYPIVFQMSYARTDIYMFSFFPDTIRDLNALPASIISPAESSEDPVARFTSLVRYRD